MVSADEPELHPATPAPLATGPGQPWWQRWLADPPAAPPPPAGGELEDRLALPDGRRLRLRPSRSEDAAALGRFFENLAPTTRRMRFHGVVNHLPLATLQGLVDWPPSYGAAWLALAEDGAGPIVAEARYVVEVDRDGRRTQAEFAIVVAEDWQGRGLARRMMARLAHEARRQGLQRLRGDVLAENQRMKALMQGLGAELQPDPRDAGLLWAHWPL